MRKQTCFYNYYDAAGRDFRRYHSVAATLREQLNMNCLKNGLRIFTATDPENHVNNINKIRSDSDRKNNRKLTKRF